MISCAQKILYNLILISVDPFRHTVNVPLRMIHFLFRINCWQPSTTKSRLYTLQQFDVQQLWNVTNSTQNSMMHTDIVVGRRKFRSEETITNDTDLRGIQLFRLFVAYLYRLRLSSWFCRWPCGIIAQSATVTMILEGLTRAEIQIELLIAVRSAIRGSPFFPIARAPSKHHNVLLIFLAADATKNVWWHIQG